MLLPWPLSCTMPDVWLFIAVLAALLVGLVTGWLAGLRQGRHELAAYRAGLQDEHERQAKLAVKQGGPCWVRGQLPPQAHD